MGRTWRLAARRAAAMAAFLVSAACAGGGGERAPREVALGVDACEYCHMAVDDASRAAQWVPASGPILTFDEPGCLVAWLQRHPGAEGQAYVAAAESGEWMAAAHAVYLAGGIRTGMGFDLVAFAGREAADGRRGAGVGEILSWEQLNERGVRDAHAH